MTFGERLVILRKENGFSTRNEFAEKLGIPSTTLRNYEKNEREPGHTFLKQISELFNVSVDYLLGLTDSKEVLNSFRLRSSEQVLIEKYRTLDSYGQETVNLILERESTRTQQIADLESRPAPEPDPRPAPDIEKMSIPEKVDLYRQELEREEKAGGKDRQLLKEALGTDDVK